MFTIGANGEKIAYGIKHYNLDTEDDLQELSKIGNMGTTCFVISTSKHYMLNSKKEWIEIYPYGSTSTSGGDSGGGDGGSGDDSPTPEDIIYEGGVV